MEVVIWWISVFIPKKIAGTYCKETQFCYQTPDLLDCFACDCHYNHACRFIYFIEVWLVYNNEVFYIWFVVRKKLLLFQSGSQCYKSLGFFFLLFLGLYFLMSITSTHQASLIVINLSPACLAFWIQKVILDHSVPERDSVFGYVTAGLWFFYLFIWSNLYVWIRQWFWCCQVAGGATFAVLGSLNRMMDHSTCKSLSSGFLDSFRALSWTSPIIDLDDASWDFRNCFIHDLAVLSCSR